ncbi:MAG TPA: hypothetical protein VND64_25295 [Pirellulales bacterium]|nr:hypothetical protein [Pirellulales bacterium]
MILRHKTRWRRLAKRFVVLGLVTLAPAMATARVPYRSKPRSDDPPAIPGASATPSNPARMPAASAGSPPSPVTDVNGGVTPPVRPATSVGGGEQATAGGTTPKPATPVASPTNSATCSAAGGLPTLGTAVHWMPTPDEAGKRAEKERKLLFLIQVSGNFARQGFT